jgi:hypothetical protein
MSATAAAFPESGHGGPIPSALQWGCMAFDSSSARTSSPVGNSIPSRLRGLHVYDQLTNWIFVTCCTPPRQWDGMGAGRRHWGDGDGRRGQGSVRAGHGTLFDPSRGLHDFRHLLPIIGLSPVLIDGGQQLGDVEHIDVPQGAHVGVHRSPHDHAA